MTEQSICPCEGFTHPQVIFNPPGRSAIAYRIGDYTSFRRALLLPLKDNNNNAIETELTNWFPGAEGDLAVQMVEWWAYLADILTFYNDRIANESYLRTAVLPESVQRSIRLLGYRPRPGIGARGIVAALVNTTKSFTLPQGYQIQSKPKPGQQPQIFELDVDTPVQFPDAIAAEPLSAEQLLTGNSVLLKGSVNTVKLDDRLLLLEKGWNGTSDGYVLVTVENIQPEKEPSGKTNTRISFASTPDIDRLKTAKADRYQLLKSNQSAHLYLYKTSHAIDTDHLHLESIQRDIKVGDPLLLENPDRTPNHQLINVTQYTEFLWYANTPNANDPSQPPDANREPPVPILHSRPYFKPQFSSTLAAEWDGDRSRVLVRFNWQEVGQLIAKPEKTFDGTPPALKLAKFLELPAGNSPIPLLIEDTKSQGVSAKGALGTTSDLFNLSALPPSPFSLNSPLSVLFNLLSVSRGQTVPSEILGSGDASLAGQEFGLKKSPLTYLLSGDSTSGGNYKSTLRIWVNDIEWQEVPSFYGQPPNASVFVTREDENGQTRVQFGDGFNGARLPSGINNVVARYRYGSGKEAPDAGALSVIVKPYPNLKAIRNPVPVGGGADPEPPEQIRRYAPRSILTFGRAVSGDDYETIAAQTPGVARAKVYWTWDAAQQRSLVKLYVGDDDSAVSAAKIALAGTADPNRPVAVQLVQPLPVQLTLTLQIEATRIPETVMAAVKEALLNPDTGLFGTNVMQIGQAIYQSQIYATCMQVPGVLAVHRLGFRSGAFNLLKVIPLETLNLLKLVPPETFNIIKLIPLETIDLLKLVPPETIEKPKLVSPELLEKVKLVSPELIEKLN